MRKTPLIAFLFLTTLVAACTPKKTPEEMITRTWQIRTFHTSREMGGPPDFLTNNQFMFRADGKYEILMGELDLGTWKLSDNKKVLLTYPQGSTIVNSIDIEYLSDTLLVLSNQSGPAPVRMELVPMGTIK